MNKIGVDSGHLVISCQTIRVESLLPYTRRIPIQLIGKADFESTHSNITFVTDTRTILDGRIDQQRRIYRKYRRCKRENQKERQDNPFHHTSLGLNFDSYRRRVITYIVCVLIPIDFRFTHNLGSPFTRILCSSDYNFST